MRIIAALGTHDYRRTLSKDRAFDGRRGRRAPQKTTKSIKRCGAIGALAEAGERTDARIAALVSAIGEHVQQGHPQK